MQEKEKADETSAQLNRKLLNTETALSAAKTEAASKSQSERVLRRRYESLQKQVKDGEVFHEQRLQGIQVRPVSELA